MSGHSPESRSRISRGVRLANERRRQRERILPRHLRDLARGVISPRLSPLVAIAQDEVLALTQALGGAEEISEQRQMLIEDIATVGILMRALARRFLQGSEEPDLASRIGTLAGQRRASFQALGLERQARQVDLREYLALRTGDEGSEVPISHEDAPEVGRVDDHGHGGRDHRRGLLQGDFDAD